MTAFNIEVHYAEAPSSLWPEKPEQPYVFKSRAAADKWVDEFFSELPITCISTSIVPAA